MIESTVFPQKKREKCILATKQKTNTQQKLKKKEDLLEMKFGGGTGILFYEECIWLNGERRRAQWPGSWV